MSAHLGYTSVVHRVLEIPEIIEQILNYLDVKENLRVAAVCKRWADIAHDIAWRHVDDIVLLFRLLAPVVARSNEDGKLQYDFERRLRASDWERFSTYARRVRSLTYRPAPHLKRDLSTTAFDEIARNRPPTNILPVLLPNLQELRWIFGLKGRSEYSLMFMNDRVTKFTVSLPEDDSYPNQSWLEDIRLRMPDLTLLDISFNIPMHDLEQDAVRLFSSLTKLKKIVLPVFTITSRVIECLSKLPHLGTIQFEFMDQGTGEVEDVISFTPRMEEGAFPSLWDLSLSATMYDITSFITADYAPTNITSLYVHVLDAATLLELSQFLTAVSENCQLLTHLYVYMTKHPAYAQDESPSGDAVTWDVLKAILNCPNLVYFHLVWDRPVKLTQENIEELAAKWPSLESLFLNCEPLFPDEDSTLTLHALIPLARHCPNLRELGLYISTQGYDISAHGPITPFQSLVQLNFGLSRIVDAGPTALFLSEICPSGCNVVSGVTWPEDLGTVSEDLAPQIDEWADCWQEVADLLPLLTKVRSEERWKRYVREREAEELRRRLIFLSEKEVENQEKDAARSVERYSLCIIA